MLTWILIVLAAPGISLFLLVYCGFDRLLPGRWSKAVFDWVKSLRGYPGWISYVMGHSRPTAKDRFRSVLFWWISWLCMVEAHIHIRVRSWLCGLRGHRFDKSYGRPITGTKANADGSTEFELGEPSRYCSRCYLWEKGGGFLE